MKWISKDPTAEDYDQVKLTPEEWKKVRRDCAICTAILLSIYFLICW